MRRLLVVEDDAAIRDGIVCLLRRNGYAAAAVTDFADVAGQILAAAPDLVLLDLNLPGVDGGFTCREVRASSQVPIIAVTSRDTDMDELVTLSAGADDFVTKPYNEQVLLARISSVLKRSYGEGAAASARVSVRGVTLDTARCEVSFEGRTAELTKNELRILALLMRSAGSVVSRQRIQEELWESDDFVDDNTLTVNVSHLRQTLGRIGVEGFIGTRRGLGYIVESGTREARVACGLPAGPAALGLRARRGAGTGRAGACRLWRGVRRAVACGRGLPCGRGHGAAA